MTKAQIAKITSNFKLENYNLLCDNGIKLRHTPKYPIGYFTENEDEFAVQLRPNTLQTNSSHVNPTTGREVPHFTTLIIPLSSVQYVEFNPVKEEAPDILNYLKAKGAFTTEQATALLNNKELFGIR